MEQKKLCPYCKSEINVEAKKCPHCQSNLLSFAKRPLGCGTSLLIVVGILLLLYFFINTLIGSSSNGLSDTSNLSGTTQQPSSLSLSLVGWKVYRDPDTGSICSSGEVKNTSGNEFDFVKAIITYNNKANNFVSSDYAYLSEEKLLPGNSSPFQTCKESDPSDSSVSLSNDSLSFTDNAGDSLTVSNDVPKTKQPTTPSASVKTATAAAPPSAPINWLAYQALPADFSKNPPFYIGTKVKIDGAVTQFLAAGDRGGTTNFIEITPVTNQVDTLPNMMLEIDSSYNYQQSVSVLSQLSAVTAYGTIEASQQFTTAGGGAQYVPVIKVARLDTCNTQFACTPTSITTTVFQ